MPKVVLNPTPIDGTEYLVNCPGCQMDHWFRTEGAAPVWGFNGDLENPIVTPSLMVRGRGVCHSYITNGQFIYLSDCTHHLAGKTVPIPEYSEDF